MNSLEANVLQVISTQHENYLVKPDSSCFVASGIEPPERVQVAIDALVAEGYIEQYDDMVEVTSWVTETDDAGDTLYEEDGKTPQYKLQDVKTGTQTYVNSDTEETITFDVYTTKPVTELIEVVADTGFVITDAGREALANL